MPWFDAGVNLLDKRFDANDIIARAKENGVDNLCIITTHPDEWSEAEALYQRFPDSCCYTIGVHPHNAKVVNAEHYSLLEKFAQKPGCVAIGECGLDFNRDFSPRDIQKQVFEAQLIIAKALDLPVFLHERDAFNDQIQLLKKYNSCIRGGIAHCFTGNEAQVKAYLSLGLYIGVTGWFCDEKRGDALRGAVKQIPLDKIILETDAPYLFPKTLKPRKRNNEPAYLPHIAEQLSNYLNVDNDKLQSSSYANTCKLFCIE